MENSVFNELLKTPPKDQKKHLTPCLQTVEESLPPVDKQPDEILHPRKFNFFENASPTTENSNFRKINMNPAMDFIKFLEEDVIEQLKENSPVAKKETSIDEKSTLEAIQQVDLLIKELEEFQESLKRWDPTVESRKEPRKMRKVK